MNNAQKVSHRKLFVLGVTHVCDHDGVELCDHKGVLKHTCVYAQHGSWCTRCGPVARSQYQPTASEYDRLTNIPPTHPTVYKMDGVMTAHVYFVRRYCRRQKNISSFHQYPRGCYKSDTIMFCTPDVNTGI